MTETPAALATSLKVARARFLRDLDPPFPFMMSPSRTLCLPSARPLRI
jgi:hypothetical protein